MTLSRTQQVKRLYKNVYGIPLSHTMSDAIELMTEETYIEFYDVLIDKLNLKIDLYFDMEEERDHMKFLTRLQGMMDDYDLTLKEAMEWDAEGFILDIDKNKREKYISSYLSRNKLSDDRLIFYREIFLGKRKDFQLTKN